MIRLKCKPSLFADDKCLIVKASTPVIFQQKNELELVKLYNWCCTNKLTINPSKTNIIIIPPKLRNIDSIHLNINCVGTPVNIVDNVKH